ncbi:MAG TPA: TolC family protein, partial [Candidatus Melainabacteria bacterium]|nr:TolC family protein [Candidatus Melainabacteria bacterium]
MVPKILSASSKLLALTALLLLSINSIAQPAIAEDSSEEPELRPPIKTQPEEEKTDDLSAFDKLEDKETILINPEKLIIKPPVLKALIKLDQPVSPLHIEADGNRDITLGDVLKTALRNNLEIKISEARKESAKWRFYEDVSHFLPDVGNSLSLQAIQGKVASPAGAILRIKSPYLTTGSGFNWTLFKGGERIFQAKEGRHRMKASAHALKGSINDVLLQATKLYYELVLNDALLQIRVKAVEESKAILQL